MVVGWERRQGRSTMSNVRFGNNVTICPIVSYVHSAYSRTGQHVDGYLSSIHQLFRTESWSNYDINYPRNYSA